MKEFIVQKADLVYEVIVYIISLSSVFVVLLVVHSEGGFGCYGLLKVTDAQGLQDRHFSVCVCEVT